MKIIYKKFSKVKFKKLYENYYIKIHIRQILSVKKLKKCILNYLKNKKGILNI